MRIRALCRCMAVTMATLFAVGVVSAVASPAAASSPRPVVAAAAAGAGVQSAPQITSFACESGSGMFGCFLRVSGTYTSIQWYLVRNGNASPIGSDTLVMGIACWPGDQVRVTVANGAAAVSATTGWCRTGPWH